MKKATLEKTLSLISSIGTPEAEEIRAEISAELTKGQAKAEANRAVYADIHDKIIPVLASATAPVTAQELADETGIARGKIVYGLKNLWADEVEVIPGKTNTYRLAQG